MFWKNWKTVSNRYEYHTESENPILKKDTHHAEIIDITDGLVVEERTLIMPDYKLENHEILRQDDVWCAFGISKI
jgi:hypothetical protein